MSGDGDRWLRLVSALGADADGTDLTAAGMAVSCAAGLGVFGAGVVLMVTDGVVGARYGSNPTVVSLQEAEIAVGVGPSTDAYGCGVLVVEDDLRSTPPLRWAALVEAMTAAGVRAVMALPLRIGAASLGALCLYRDRAGPLDDERRTDATVMAGILTRAILSIQAGSVGEALAGGLADDEGDHADQVHQASGILSVQLGIGVGEALARLRARAFADGTTVGLLAVEVVARRIHLDP